MVKTKIDTMELWANGYHALADVMQIDNVLGDKYSYSVETDTTKIVTRLAYRVNPTNKNDYYNKIEEAKEKLKESDILVNRFDICGDVALDLNDTNDYKQLRLYAELHKAVQGEKTLLQTDKNIFDVGCIKFNNQTLGLTIYDTSDKLRFGSTRIEYRFKQLAQLKQDLLIKNAIKKIARFGKGFSSALELVEVYYADKLYKRYVHMKDNREIRDFKSFLESNNRFFLTKNIFELVYNRLLSTGEEVMSPKLFINNYRKTQIKGVYRDNGKPQTLKIKFATLPKIKKLHKVIMDDIKLNILN